jgi:hypothetical protein
MTPMDLIKAGRLEDAITLFEHLSNSKDLDEFSLYNYALACQEAGRHDRIEGVTRYHRR